MATECFAYLQQVITDPDAAVVQEQIKGNVVKMLIILPDGDQKMVVFDIPLENCTVLTLLQQVKKLFVLKSPSCYYALLTDIYFQAGVSYNSGTVISLVDDPSEFGINYIVEIQNMESVEQNEASDIR